MARRNPFEELEQLIERMSRQVEGGDWAALTGGSIAIDVADTGDAFEIAADLPGYERDDIDITLTGDSLQISAQQSSDIREESDIEDGRYLRRERRERAVSRTVRIPEAVNEEAAQASYNNGVLRVTLPKADPSEEGRRIDIE